ncbi:MAG: tRNA modification GTPase [Planctomycetales bacterium]|nr:tRNA modification GTPase [Planctomycetales bacterium]
MAIASPPGGAARGIVRLSGPQSLSLVESLFVESASLHELCRNTPRSLSVRLRVSNLLENVPASVNVWPNYRSYTRQPTVEIHTFGCSPLLDALVKSLCAAGARLAQPGEFTLRSFLAGRIDLPQAEAVLGVIDAASQRQLDVGLQQLAGGLSKPLAELRDRLLNTCADLEAGLDFVDEDIQFISDAQLQEQLDNALRFVQDVLQQMQHRTTAEVDFRVILRGRPNAGKSSLWNRFARNEQALVSDVPGTTRDYLTARIRLHDVDCQWIDTAGSNLTPLHAIDASATERTSAVSQSADITVLCIAADLGISDWERQQLQQLDPKRTIVAITKADLVDSTMAIHEEIVAADWMSSVVPVSCVRSGGVTELEQLLAPLIKSLGDAEISVVGATSVRCHESLRCAAESLEAAQTIVQNNLGHELVAAELRIALDELGKVVGAIYTDDVLDRVFSRFCIGK